MTSQSSTHWIQILHPMIMYVTVLNAGESVQVCTLYTTALVTIVVTIIVVMVMIYTCEKQGVAIGFA